MKVTPADPVGSFAINPIPPTVRARTTVGHPVDVASGSVYSTHRDVRIPGQFQLNWERRYSTALLESPTALSLGWTTPYFATLTRTSAGFIFTAPEGGAELFADPEGTVERGGLIRNLGSCQELAKIGSRYVVTRWDVHSDRIERYSFMPVRSADRWPLQSIEDLTGNGLDLFYDSEGRLKTVRQRLERRALELEYSDNLLTVVVFVPPNGARAVLARYEYDDRRRLAAAHDAVGRVDRYEYTDDARLKREILKDGGAFQFQYDRQGRCIKTSGLSRYAEAALRYVDAVHFTEVTNSLGDITRFEWLPSGQVTRIVDPLGGTQRFEYDKHGRIVALINANGAVRAYEYDAAGNRTGTVNALGQRYAVTYDERHLPVKVIDPAAGEWTRTYDDRGRLIQTTNPIGQAWRLTYDDASRLTGVEHPDGAMLALRHFPDAGRIDLSNRNGLVSRHWEDTYGWIREQADAFGHATRFTYDAVGRLVRATLPNGSSVEYEYDAGGNISRVTNGNGATLHFRFGTCGRLVEQTGLSGSVKYIWGTEPRRLERIVNERGETYSFLHDACGRVTREVGFDGRQLAFEYDAAGYCVSCTSGTDQRIGYARDPLGHLIEKSLPDGSQETYRYDPMGRLVEAANADCTVTLTWDAAGRLIGENQNEIELKWTYEDSGSVVRLRSTVGGDVTYTLDANRLLSKLSTPAGSFSISRDSRGREMLELLPHGYRLEQRWTPMAQLLEQRLSAAESRVPDYSNVNRHQPHLLSRHYRYDAANNVVEITDDLAGSIRYSYDAESRLIGVNLGDEQITQLEWDSTGNLVARRQGMMPQATFAYGPGNRLLHAGHTRFEYDEHGRVIKRLPTISTGGEEGWSFRWDANDRLVEVTEPNGAVWSYKYDALGRRYAKRGPETSIRYVWDGDVILHEVMNSSASSTWLFDPCSFKLLGFIVGDELTTVLTDHLETPVAVATRRGIRRLEPHGVWGERAPIQEGSPPLPLHFPGQWWDNESGLYYSLYRYYDPSVARFISPDPLRVSAGLNLYAYTGNPVNRADPLGLNPSDIALGFSNPPMVTPLGTFPQPDGLYRFANNVGGTPYHGFDRTYPKAFPDTGGRVGGAAVYLAMQDANQIHFNLDGFPRDPNALAQMIQAGREGLPQHGNFTPWELATIMDDPELRGKARFYRDGEEVFGDPPADCAR